jgi:hypothetical protein
MSGLYRGTGKSASQGSGAAALPSVLRRGGTCDRCGKEMNHNWDDTHYESVNCRLRRWRTEMDAKGWHHAKLSWQKVFDVIRIEYEISPTEPKQGQTLYVNGEVHKILKKSKAYIDTYAGRVWLRRPEWLIEKWLREARDNGTI